MKEEQQNEYYVFTLSSTSIRCSQFLRTESPNQLLHISNKFLGEEHDKELKDAVNAALNPDKPGDSIFDIGGTKLGGSMKNEDDGSFMIFVKGKGRRKQTLRIPISLLNKTYSSRSFKLDFNRVVRESDIFRPSGVSSAEVVSSGD